MRRLFLKALDKEPHLPLAVFLDINLPPERGTSGEPAWLPEWEQTLESIKPTDWQRFNIVVATNRPYHYVPDRVGVGQSISAHRSASPCYPLPDAVLADITTAANLLGTPPPEFPKDFRVEVG